MNFIFFIYNPPKVVTWSVKIKARIKTEKSKNNNRSLEVILIEWLNAF